MKMGIMRFSKFCLVFTLSIGFRGYANAQSSNQDELNKMLHQVRGTFHVSVRQYEGTSLIREQVLQPQNNSNAWNLQIAMQPVDGQRDAIDITATCKLTAGEEKATALSAVFDFNHWSRDNYVMVPAVVYNGNRYRAIGNGYCPNYPKDMYYNPHVPLTISNNPRLQVEKGKGSLIELQTGNAATPAMCFFSPKEKKGFIVLTHQRTKFGNNGFTVAENAAQDSCLFQVTAPAMRKLAAGFGDFHASGDKAPDWKAGDELSLQLRVYVFSAKDIPALLQKFMQVRKEITGPNQPRNILPMSKLLELSAEICRNNWSENPVGNYYLPENSPDFQIGWVSGFMNTYPMLALNDPLQRKRVGEEIDFIVNKLQGKSGFFYGGITAAGKIRLEKMHPDFPAVQAMVRKNSDVLLWFMKHLMLLKAQGYASFIKPEWEQSANKLAQAFVNTWKKYGEFGQYIVPETGEIAVFNSTASAIAPGGLALAAKYFNNAEFLTVAKESADYYYERDVVAQGLTGGHSGDISQDADADSALGFLESLMALYTYTDDKKWLDKAEIVAALGATWTLSYDAVFPENSQISKLQSHMAGAVWASIQNKHAAPGICTASGDYLFKLYRATGNELYADLIRDIQHAQSEAVNIPPNHITTGNLPGSSMERIQPSDAEGRGSTGNFVHTRNSWTETDGMLMSLELPGIYVQTDRKKVYAFDHVEARIEKEDANGIVLTVSNKTSYDASVSLFAETAAMAKKPLDYTAFTKWPKLNVKTGETVKILILKNGSAQVL